MHLQYGGMTIVNILPSLAMTEFDEVMKICG